MSTALSYDEQRALARRVLDALEVLQCSLLETGDAALSEESDVLDRLRGVVSDYRDTIGLDEACDAPLPASDPRFCQYCWRAIAEHQTGGTIA